MISILILNQSLHFFAHFHPHQIDTMESKLIKKQDAFQD